MFDELAEPFLSSPADLRILTMAAKCVGEPTAMSSLSLASPSHACQNYHACQNSTDLAKFRKPVAMSQQAFGVRSMRRAKLAGAAIRCKGCLCKMPLGAKSAKSETGPRPKAEREKRSVVQG